MCAAKHSLNGRVETGTVLHVDRANVHEAVGGKERQKDPLQSERQQVQLERCEQLQPRPNQVVPTIEKPVSNTNMK